MQKQQGFISIITASIIMVILTILVISFSQVMQREQRQALDRQLSSQAVYAAETAVNDLYARLQNDPSLAEEKPTCEVTDWPTPGANGRVDPTNSTNGAAYTCLKYDQTPEQLIFNNGAITTNESKIFPIEPVSKNDNNKVKDITFSWSGARNDTDLTLGPPLHDCTAQPLPASVSGGIPILRLDLIRLPSSGTYSSSSIVDNTITVFLYPQGSGCGESSADFVDLLLPAQKGALINVKCENINDYACSFTIDAPQADADASDRYIARVRSIYNDADLYVEANGTAVGNGGIVEFLGAQVAVDATGKSNDVLRRIGVQIGNPNYSIPEYVVRGLDGVCKQSVIIPPNTVPATSFCTYP